jgi:hypothetical protein
MKYKIEQYERCETTSSGSIEDHLIGITKPSIDRMLKMDNAGDCIALYTFYCYTRKWQKNSMPKATSEYAMDGLKWGRERFSKAKANLLELGLIEDVQRIGENGRVLGWYIGVKFAQNATKGEFQIAELDENHPTGFPQGGETRVWETRIQIPITGNKIPNTSKQIQITGRENSAIASSSTTDDLFKNSSLIKKPIAARSAMASRPKAIPENLAAFQIRANRLLGRRDSTKWASNEIKSAANWLDTTEEEWNLLEGFYANRGKEGYYCRTNMITLLNNWSSEIDKARSKQTKQEEEIWKPTTI